jgi:hypothetical protein
VGAATSSIARGYVASGVDVGEVVCWVLNAGLIGRGWTGRVLVQMRVVVLVGSAGILQFRRTVGFFTALVMLGSCDDG